MALFSTRTDEEKQAEADCKAAEKQAEADRNAREKYLKSPVGQAETAYENGQGFFQLRVNISEIKGHASDSIWSVNQYSQSTRARHHSATDVLGQIEETGWRLEHVGYVFVETGEVSRAKAMSSGTVTRNDGYVEGIYLFRRRERA